MTTTKEMIRKETQNLIEIGSKELSKLTDHWSVYQTDNLWAIQIHVGDQIHLVNGESQLSVLKNAINEARKHSKPSYELIDHPSHYGGLNAKHEAISVIEEWNLNFHLGNVIKYVSRAGRKPDQSVIDDLKKAKWYLERQIEILEKNKNNT